ncbi:MAG: group II intron reverse transcriptase/maturase [Rhodoferax sp.]|uniref:group II intron reverse transcriptase/maturase n=1 Tax=Rhodoferax sp. TaxID=50421 RepID=UPI0030183BE2
MSESVTVPVKAKQTESAPTEWVWVDRAIWTERMLAALGNGVKGRKWFSLIDKVYRPGTLQAAWQQVKANKGAAGIDRQSIEGFAANELAYLGELARDLEQGKYRPQAVRRVDIPKAGGKTRPLGIPTVKDRIVQTAVKRVIEPIFENEFLDISYGFRPGKGCKDALREVDGHLKDGYTHVVDADLQGYFDSIPHDSLTQRIEEHISDGCLLQLLASWLRQDIVKDVQRWTPTAGTPQGAVISPLLANLYLHPLDVKMPKLGYRMVRYADDFVILCQTASQAQAALEEVKVWVQGNGLTLHPDKTHVGDCSVWGQGFEFLGYRFEAGRRWVRGKSLKGFKDKVREKTKRTRGESLRTIVEDLTPMIRGWFEYFKHARRTTFEPLDGFIRRRMRAVLRKQEKRPGMGRCHDDHRRWPNVYFANLGLFTMATAHRASRSR